MRLIDADELLNSTIYNPLHAPYITKQDVIYAPTIKATVDAVPVVRCKDCRYRDKTDVERGLCLCTVHDTRVRPEWYCWVGYPWEDGETHG